MSDRPTVYIPVSRFVSGSMTEKRTTDSTRAPIPEDKQRYEFGLALRKDSPQVNDFWAQYMAAAQMCYANQPQVHQLMNTALQNGLNGFAFKISDGDKPNLQGQINPNFAGCWVIWCSTGIPVMTYDNTNAQLDPNNIQRGFYVDAQVNVTPNNLPAPRTGVYINPDMVRLQYQGEIIRGGPDPQEILNNMSQHQVAPPPPGATALGTAPATTPLPGMGPGAPAPQPAPQAPMAAPQAPMAAPQAPVAAPQAPVAAPHMQAAPQPAPTGVMPGVPQPPVAGAVPPTGVPTSPTAPTTGSPPAHPGILQPPGPPVG